MKNEIAVVSTLYPSVQPYVGDLVSSLKAQTIKDFDWVVINDGADEVGLLNIVDRKLSTHILNMRGVPPVENRWLAIRWCKENGYRYVIFQDSDDWMTESRIERSVEAMSQAGIVFCDLTLVSEEGRVLKENIWSERFRQSALIDYNFIADKNCIGLGNAALDLTVVRGDIKTLPGIVAVDWFLFYQVIQNTQACYIENSVFYRQYRNNLAGRPLLSRESIGRCLEVKQKHYLSLLPMFSVLKDYILKIEDFTERIYKNETKLEEYINKYISNSSTAFWWEESNYNYE